MTTAAPQGDPQKPDEIYVGYLPVPRGILLFARIAVVVLLCAAAALAGLWSRAQSDPGSAVWDDGTIRAYHGTVVAAPYAMMVPDDAMLSPIPLLIVEMGKRGGGQRALPFVGQHVRINGWHLQRDGREMIELAPDDDAVVADDGPRASVFEASLGQITLRGEIVDSKCYLGAMKPGDGKTHKACATLCVTGGIPPMLVTSEATTRYVIITDEFGKPMPEPWRSYIADPVQVTGELVNVGGLLQLRVREGGIERL